VSPPEGAAILEIAGASYAYDRRPALVDVWLAVRAGEIYALLGPNGAGKSTLVRAICGRIRLMGGKLTVAGGDPRREPSARAALGLVPQDLALYPHLTVVECLQVFASLCGVASGKVAAAVDRAMRLTRTSDQAGARIATLSGGFQRRVNIAAAILHQPKLLILDEPTVGVDVTSCEALTVVIADLAHDGVAVLMVTHDLGEAGALATRVGFLVEGRLVLEGRPDGLIAEMFGDQMEVVLSLTRDVDAAEQAALRNLGFSPGGAPADWMLLSADGYGVVAGLEARLGALGAAVAEIRVRRPSLHSLYAGIAATGGPA
jgi:ABC-2 type transport system ATP-binding protein